MISAGITVNPRPARSVLVEIAETVQDRRGLHAVLAQRLANELKDHFRERNARPNKRGWKKTGFWNQLGRATAVESVDADGAIVAVADARFRIHLFGGTIKPTGGRKWLAIPLVQDAAGLNVASYERKTKRELFRLPGSRVLVEKRSRGGDRSSIAGGSGRRRDGSAVPVAARQELRAVYALAASVTIDRDPDALPPIDKLASALREEAADYIARELAKGGAA